MAELAALLNQEQFTNNVEELLRGDGGQQHGDNLTSSDDDFSPLGLTSPVPARAVQDANKKPEWGRGAMGGKDSPTGGRSARGQDREPKKKGHNKSAAVARWLRDADLAGGGASPSPRPAAAAHTRHVAAARTQPQSAGAQRHSLQSLAEAQQQQQQQQQRGGTAGNPKSPVTTRSSVPSPHPPRPRNDSPDLLAVHLAALAANAGGGAYTLPLLQGSGPPAATETAGDTPLSWRYRPHTAGMRPARERILTEDGAGGVAGVDADAAGAVGTSTGAPESAVVSHQGVVVVAGRPKSGRVSRQGHSAVSGNGELDGSPPAWQLPSVKWWNTFQGEDAKHEEADESNTTGGGPARHQGPLPLPSPGHRVPQSLPSAGPAPAAAAGFPSVTEADEEEAGSRGPRDGRGSMQAAGRGAGADAGTNGSVGAGGGGELTATSFGFERVPLAVTSMQLQPAASWARHGSMKRDDRVSFGDDGALDDGNRLPWGRQQHDHSFDARSAYHGGGAGGAITPRRHSVYELEEAQHGGHKHHKSFRERLESFHPLVVVDALLPIFNPVSTPRRSWDLLIMSMVIWTAVTVPLSVSFGLPTNTIWDAVDYAMTCLFAVDLVINFRTAFYNHQGELVRDSRAIATNYMKMWFWIDAVGTIPFDSIVLWTGALANAGEDSTTLAALGFLKAPRMLRLGRLLRFLDSFKNVKIFRIVQLFLAMILISHWLACVWFMMYHFGGKKNAEDWAFMIAVADGGGSQEIAWYIVLFYYSFLLLVGDNIPALNNYERTFYCVVELLGIFFYAAVVGQMATLVATMNVTVNRHAQKSIMTQDTLRYMGVPEKNKEDVQEYFDFLQARSHPGTEGMAFLRELPSGMLRELQMYMYFKSVEKVPLFANLENGFLRALAMRVQLTSMHPKEPVFRVGDVGHNMYVIRKGCVAVTSSRNELCALLKPGDIFGEVALLSTGKRTANCTALGFVDLAVLGKQELQVVMSDYPQSAALIRQRAAARVQELTVSRKLWLADDDDDLPPYIAPSGKGAAKEEPQQEDEDDGNNSARSGDSGGRCSGSGRASSGEGDGGDTRGMPGAANRYSAEEQVVSSWKPQREESKLAGSGLAPRVGSTSSSREANRHYISGRSLEIARPKDVLQLTPRDSNAGLAGAGAGASTRGSSLPLAVLQQAVVLGPEGSVGSPASSRPASRVYWRSIDVARPTDVLALTPREGEQQSPKDHAARFMSLDLTAKNQAARAAAAVQASEQAASARGQYTRPANSNRPAELAEPAAGPSGTWEPSSRAPSRTASRLPSRGTSGDLASTAAAAAAAAAVAATQAESNHVALATIFTSSFYAPTTSASSPARGSAAVKPDPRAGYNGGAAARARSATGPGPVAEAVLDTASPPGGYSQPGQPSGAGVAGPDLSTISTIDGAASGTSRNRTAGARRSSVVSYGQQGAGVPPLHPHRAFATPSPPPPLLAEDGLQSAGQAHSQAHSSGGTATGTGTGTGDDMGGTGNGMGGTGIPSPSSVGRKLPSRRGSNLSRKASQNLTQWYMDQLNLNTSPRDLQEHGQNQTPPRRREQHPSPPGQQQGRQAGQDASGDGMQSRGGEDGSPSPTLRRRSQRHSNASVGSTDYGLLPLHSGGASGAAAAAANLAMVAAHFPTEREGRSSGWSAAGAATAAGSGRVPRLLLPPNAATSGASGPAATAAGLEGAAAALVQHSTEPHIHLVIGRLADGNTSAFSSSASAGMLAVAGGASQPRGGASLHERDRDRCQLDGLSTRNSTRDGQGNGGGGGGGGGATPTGMATAQRRNKRDSVPRSDGPPSATGRFPPLVMHTYVPATSGGDDVQRLADGGYYVSEKRWMQIMAVLHSFQGCEDAVTALQVRVVEVDEGVRRLESAQDTLSFLAGVTGLAEAPPPLHPLLPSRGGGASNSNDGRRSLAIDAMPGVVPTSDGGEGLGLGRAGTLRRGPGTNLEQGLLGRAPSRRGPISMSGTAPEHPSSTGELGVLRRVPSRRAQAPVADASDTAALAVGRGRTTIEGYEEPVSGRATTSGGSGNGTGLSGGAAAAFGSGAPLMLSSPSQQPPVMMRGASQRRSLSVAVAAAAAVESPAEAAAPGSGAIAQLLSSPTPHPPVMMRVASERRSISLAVAPAEAVWARAEGALPNQHHPRISFSPETSNPSALGNGGSGSGGSFGGAPTQLVGRTSVDVASTRHHAAAAGGGGAGRGPGPGKGVMATGGVNRVTLSGGFCQDLVGAGSGSGGGFGSGKLMVGKARMSMDAGGNASRRSHDAVAGAPRGTTAAARLAAARGNQVVPMVVTAGSEQAWAGELRTAASPGGSGGEGSGSIGALGWHPMPAGRPPADPY